MESVLTFPSRGKWGDYKWRGNCSGHVIVELIKHFNPKLFIDICEGSGTSRDVCRDMGVDYQGFDLHSGTDFTKDLILEKSKKLGDLVFSHPPYHNMVEYSGKVWGESTKGDTSKCQNYDEFLAKSQFMLMNQREVTKASGIYSTLIGDYRKDGVFRSTQADFIALMPKEELISVTIKIQHNTKSGSKYYSKNFIPIKHEYLLIWKKKDKSLFYVSLNIASQNHKFIANTWRNAIRYAMIELKGEASLQDIYARVEQVSASLISQNPHWKAKIRQVLQRHYTNVQRGVWAA